MTRYRIDFAYDGTAFRGYAANRGVRTVQGELETALQRIVGAPVTTAVAGRTDAGVHASGQVVSFEGDADLDTEAAVKRLNSMLGAEIAVASVTAVDDDFHARFSATNRTYHYRVREDPTPDPFTRRYVWHVGEVLDIDAMNRSATAFVGEHDFTSFCRSVEGKSNVRRVLRAQWRRIGPEAVLEISSTAFCHQMVRSLVALMVDVGRGLIAAEATAGVIEARDRQASRGVAPPHGLVLWSVGY